MLPRYSAFPGAIRERSGRYLPRRPVLAGALVTAAATHLLMVTPELIAFPEFRADLFAVTGVWLLDDPFGLVQFLGGVGGGYATGYLTGSNHWRGVSNSLQAVLLGVVVYYVTGLGWNVLSLLVAGNLSLSLLLFLVLQPLIFVVVPMCMLYVFQGMFSSPIGSVTATTLVPKLTQETLPGDPTEIEAALARWLVVWFVGLALFATVWGLGFYLTAGLFTYRP